MTKQVIKAIYGYSVTYYSDRKANKFVIKQYGKVVASYADFRSCLIYLDQHIGNFETL